MGPRDARLRDRAGALRTKDAVDPSVLVPGEPHVIDVDIRLGGLRQADRVVPETPVIDTVRAFGHREERFSVHALDTSDHQVAALVLDGAGVEYGVDSEALEQLRVRRLFQIIAPENRRVRCRQYRVAIAVDHPIATGDALVRPSDERFIRTGQCAHACIERSHVATAAISGSSTTMGCGSAGKSSIRSYHVNLRMTALTIISDPLTASACQSRSTRKIPVAVSEVCHTMPTTTLNMSRRKFVFATTPGCLSMTRS